MNQELREKLLSQATVIRTERGKFKNTAERVGRMLTDIINAIGDDSDNDMFEKVTLSDDKWYIRAKADLVGVGEITAYGTDGDNGEGDGSQPGYARRLSELADVSVANPSDGQALVWDSSALNGNGAWVAKSIAAGLDLSALSQYLQENKYVTQSWVKDQGFIANLDLSHLLSKEDAKKTYLPRVEFDELFEKVTLGNGSWYIKAKANFVGVGEITAYGTDGDNGKPGVGVIQSLGGLADVSLTASLAAGQALVWDGTAWVNRSIASGLDESALAKYLQDHGFLNKHQAIYGLTFAAGAFEAKAYNPAAGAVTVNIPASTDHVAEGASRLYFTDARAVAALAPTVNSLNTAISKKLDKATFDEMFEKVTVNGSWYIRAKANFVGVGEITAYGADSDNAGGTGAGTLDVASLAAYLSENKYLTRPVADSLYQPKGNYLPMISAATDLNTPEWHNQSITFQGFNNTAANAPAHINNANGVLNLNLGLHGTGAQYGGQIAISSNSYLYYRYWQAGKQSSWRRLAFADEIPSLNNYLHFGLDDKYVAARFLYRQELANKAAEKYIEFWQSGAGWFNFMAGKYIVSGGTASQFLKADGSLDSTSYLSRAGGSMTNANVVTNLNADLLDGKHASWFAVFNEGLNANNANYNTYAYDRDTLLTVQSIHIPNYTGQTNTPFANNYGQMLTFGGDRCFFPFRLAMRYSDAALFVQAAGYKTTAKFDFSSGTAWKQLAFASEYYTKADADNRYARLAMPNNFCHASNEWTTIATDTPNLDLFINYRLASGSGSIYQYRFGNGTKNGYARVLARSFVMDGGRSFQVLMADGSTQIHWYASDMTTATADNGMITPLAMNQWTSKTFLKLTGGTMANTNVVANLNADLLDGVHYRNILERTDTVNRQQDAAAKWYRVAQFKGTNATGLSGILSIARTYNSPANEAYVFAISLGYNGEINISQLSGQIGGHLISKIRVTCTNSGDAYVDIYCGYKNYQNALRVTAIGALTALGITPDPAALSITKEYATHAGVGCNNMFTSFGSGADVGFRASGSQYKVWFGVGSGNVNRGIYDENNGSWMLYRAGSTDIYIPQGRLGVGTTAPAYKIDAAGDIRAQGWLRTSGNTGWYSDTFGGGIYMTDGTWVRVYNGKGFYSGSGQIRSDTNFCRRGYGGSSWNNGYGAYNTAVLNNSNQTPLMVAFRDGAEPDATGSNRLFALELLNAGSDLHFAFGGANKFTMTSAGNFLAVGEVTAYSDRRLKSDIKPLYVKGRLRPVRYRKDGRYQVGLIAQEVRELCPEAVMETNTPERYLALSHNAAYAAALSGVYGELDDHERRLKKLESRLTP